MQRIFIIVLFMAWLNGLHSQNIPSCVDAPILSSRNDWKIVEGFDSSWIYGLTPTGAAKTIDPSRQLEELPEILPGRLYTLYINIEAKDTCATDQYLCVQQSSASRIYLDGKPIASFGQLSTIAGQIRAFDPLNQPIPLPPITVGKHRLLIVFALQPSLRPRSMFGRIFPLFDGKILPRAQAMDLYANRRATGMEYSNWAIFIVLFLIHIFSYLVDPSSKLHGWFSLFALVNLLMGIPGIISHDPVWLDQKIFSNLIISILRILAFVFLSITYLTILKPISRYWMIPIIGSVFLATLNDWFTPSQYRLGLNFFLEVLGPALMAIIAYRKMRAGNASARYLFWGTMTYLICWITFLFLIPFNLPGIIFDFIFKVTVLCIPLSISMVLSHQFRFTSNALEKETREKEKLAKEKEQLLLEENKNLEAEVARRTEDLVEKNRELEIETALEKVRSRTLAMQNSNELAGAATVMFQQLIALGIAPNRLYIAVIKDENGEAEFWVTDEEGSKVSTAFTANLHNNSSTKKMYDGWLGKQKSIVIDIRGEELQNYFKYLSLLGVHFKGSLDQRRLQYISYFNKGFIGLASPQEQSPETIQLLERFAAVFNLTFTRFNDLKIAEANALRAARDLVEIKDARRNAEEALAELQATQKQLIQSEKMASLGELTAGIAHEIQNPLNFVNNFSDLNTELIDELRDELKKGDVHEALSIAEYLKDNEAKINLHGKRADGIVKSMLQHSRASSGQKEFSDLNKLVDEYVRLAYHGFRARKKDFDVKLDIQFDPGVGGVNIVAQDIGRVLLNLLNNAFQAVEEKALSAGPDYQPTVTVSIGPAGNKTARPQSIAIVVTDNGPGIPDAIKDKIFQPFFTTKPTGQGTGLGLSLAYDIIKAHGGEMTVASTVGEHTKFTVVLPIA